MTITANENTTFDMSELVEGLFNAVAKAHDTVPGESIRDIHKGALYTATPRAAVGYLWYCSKIGLCITAIKPFEYPWQYQMAKLWNIPVDRCAMVVQCYDVSAGELCPQDMPHDLVWVDEYGNINRFSEYISRRRAARPAE